MDVSALKELLENVAAGQVKTEDALEQLKKLPYENLDFASIDHHRSLRTGFPEVIYCPGKTPEQTGAIVQRMLDKNAVILASRAEAAHYEAIKAVAPHAVYFETARTVVVRQGEAPEPKGLIAVVTAGTSDIPVAEEAAVTAEAMDNRVLRVYDVGVAGVHRLLARLDEIRQAQVLIVVAGMEGALASVVGGLVDCPVIAVPTSVGYGANFGGLSALLAMLNSCANGVGVVNIDNGYGAACLASKINQRICK